jgi:uncharacterized protein YycO
MHTSKITSQNAVPTESYIFDTTKLRIGDIILTTVVDSPLSKAIRTATKSRFSHAAMVVREGIVIEATGDGIKLSSLVGAGARDPENVRVLRMASIDENQRKNLENSLGHLFKKYSKVGAVLSITDINHEQPDSEFFCSQLVAKSYSDAEIELLSKKPSKVVPQDFADCSILQDITETVLRQITLGDQEWHQVEYLDDGRKKIDLPDHNKLIQLIVEDVKKQLAVPGVDQINTLNELCFLLRIEFNVVPKERLHSLLLQEFANHNFAGFPARLASDAKASFDSAKHIIDSASHINSISGLEELLRRQQEQLKSHQASINARAQYIAVIESEFIAKCDSQWHSALTVVRRFYSEIQEGEKLLAEENLKAISFLESKISANHTRN